MGIELWSDGACANNPGPGGWAYVIRREDGATVEGSGGVSATTNNRMEIRAVIEGLRALERDATVTVYSDSAYVLNAYLLKWVTRWKRAGWMRPSKKTNGRPQELKNADLWQQLDDEVSLRNVSWEKVLGHSGISLNERCDELAVAATIAAGGRREDMVEFRKPAARPAVKGRRSQEKPRRTHSNTVRLFNASDLDDDAKRRYGF